MQIVDLLKQTYQEFSNDNCSRIAAAIAYYAIFSLPPLLVLIILLAGFVLEPQTIQGAIQDQIQSFVGPQAAQQIQSIIQEANSAARKGGTLATIISVIVLIIGATGVFTQLQTALNDLWEVESDPEQGGGFSTVITLVVKRLFSFVMILVIAVLLLASLVIGTVLSAFGEQLFGSGAGVLLQVLNIVVSLGVFTLLFAAIYKVLPDARIAWSDVWLGAAVTAFLFVIGKFLFGLYLGYSNPGSTFGAAGAVILLLLWIYVSAIILFFGVEFTQVHLQRRGRHIEPSDGSVRVVEEKRYVR